MSSSLFSRLVDKIIFLHDRHKKKSHLFTVRFKNKSVRYGVKDRGLTYLMKIYMYRSYKNEDHAYIHKQTTGVFIIGLYSATCSRHHLKS